MIADRPIVPLGRRLRLQAEDHPRRAELIAAADALDAAGPVGAAGHQAYAPPFSATGYTAALNRVRALVKELSADPGQN